MKILCVGKSPGFNQKAMEELAAAWERIDLPEAEHCTLLEKMLAKNKDPNGSQIAEAIPALLDRIEQINPDIIMPMGGICTRALLGVPIVCSHGIPHQVSLAGADRVIFSTYDPAAGIQNKAFFAAFYYDLLQFRKYLDGSVHVWNSADLSGSRVEWLREVPRRLWEREVRSVKGIVALDTEGWAVKPWGVSFCGDGKRAFVIKADDTEALAWLSTFIARATLTMHNGIHDVPVLRKMGVSVRRYHDTQVLAYHEMMRSGSGVLEQEAQNLGTLSYRYLGMELKDLADLPGVDFDAMEIPYSDDVMHYAGMDVISDYRLFINYEQQGLVNDPVYQIDMSQVALVEEMIAAGMPFDVNATADYLVEILGKKDAVTAELQEMAARRGNRDFNPGSHPQVRELVTKKYGLRVRKRTKGGLASTNEKALAPFKEHIFVQKLQTYRELSKLEGTYLYPLMEELSQ